MQLSARTDQATNPLVDRLCMSPLQRRTRIPEKCGIANGNAKNGMGLVPVVWALALGAGALALAGRKAWERLGPTPQPDRFQLNPAPPVAPTGSQLIVPGAFDPSTMHERTMDIRRNQQQAFSAGMQAGSSAHQGDVDIPIFNVGGGEDSKILMYILLGIGGFAAIQALR